MRPDPFFITRDGASLFALFTGTATAEAVGRVLIVPPFGEELNKSRRWLALLTARLAAEGFDVLRFDLTGTGDSERGFGEATWADWWEDLRAARRVLDERSGAAPAVIVALRAGALLTEALYAHDGLTEDELLLVQPVLSGGQWLRQLLRLRVAASRFAGGSESVDGLLDVLRRGRALEVAGYEWSPALALPLEAASLAPASIAAARRADVLEISSQARAAPAPAVGKWLDRAHATGLPVGWHSAVGESFWSTQEITAPLAAVDCATELLRRRETRGG